MKHTTVYGESGVYAGWPANHGAWQWGNEFLVGFLRGKYKYHPRWHSIVPPYEKMLARSLDGGLTWSVEKPNVDFDASDEDQPMLSFDPTTDILRFCGNYDTGGEGCVRNGGVYRSTNRGKKWAGPFTYMTLTDHAHSTSRTCVLGDIAFVSAGDISLWGTDFVFAIRWNGDHFEYHSEVLSDNFRAVMPAVAQIGKRVVVVLRRRGNEKQCWIDSMYSDDGCKTWNGPFHVDYTGGWNGNPPALAALNGYFYCAYGHRDDKMIWLCKSTDGQRWDRYTMLRQGECSDIGYPRLFAHGDKLTCVYYWSDADVQEQSIQATTVSEKEISNARTRVD